MTKTPLCATRLQAALDLAEPLLRAISPDDAARHPAPGKWSPKEIIGHLVDSAANNHQRFVRGALQDDLVFPGYAQDDWVSLQRYQDADWAGLVSFWLSFNRHLATVMASVPEDVRLRVRVRHNLDQIATNAPPTPAQATLDYFMNDYTEHLSLHMRQILGERWAAVGR